MNGKWLLTKNPIFQINPLFLTIYNKYSQIINGMQQNQLLTLLTNTLNPSLLQQSQRTIQMARTNKGFATSLMLIANDTNNDIKIRQSALIVLKNMVYDQCSQRGIINKDDFQIIKASILDFLARQWGIKILTNTIRSIIHLIAQMDYPDNWPNILSDALHYLQNSKDANEISSAVQTIKAIASTCGKDQTSLIKINNFCNQITTPLLRLANKLFQNYNELTLQVLVSIFKIFNLAIFYHMPLVIQNNIHSIMIYVKKIIDMNGDAILPLKLICLKILSRIYSRHVRQDIHVNLLKFAHNFHNSYSVPFTQSFVLQLMSQNSTTQICNLSLNCLTCIYKNHEPSTNLIKKNYISILRSCLFRYKLKNIQKEQSVGGYITHVQEQRSQLIDFIEVLLKQNDELLGQLINIMNNGDQTIKEIVLYIFSALGQELEDYPHLYDSMSQFIVQYILPVLSDNDSPIIMKARGCEVISAYSRYVQIPSQNIQPIFQFIYSCLTQSKSSYLNIYALQAFTLLICKYDQFMKLIIPYLQDILKVYTDLMKQSNGEVMDVIKSFQLFLSNLNGNDIQNYAIDLIKFLIHLFYQYSNSQTNQNTDQSQDEQDEDQDEENIPNAKKGCLACIREIMAVDLPQSIYSVITDQFVLPLSIDLLLDKNLDNFQQCLNILNLCLYKSEQLPKNFDQFFKIFAYSIIGIPNELGSINLPSQYKQILTNVCVNPDEDIVSNVVGFFRNFIAKSKDRLRDFKDQIGISFMEYIFKIVEWVHNSQNEKGQLRYKASERFMILTLYTSLVQFQFLNNNQFAIILDNLMNWYSHVQNLPANQTNPYIEILLVCLFYYSELTSNKLNIQWFVQELIARQKLFYDQYQLQRIINGVVKLIERQMLKNQQTGTKIVKMIPDLVSRLITIRGKDQQLNSKRQSQQQIDSQEQAIQDFIGDNTHLGNFPHNTTQQNINKKTQSELQKQLNAVEEIQWQAQFNKYYFSPFFAYNQLQYLRNVLKDSPYTTILTKQQQQRLSQYLCNIPQKRLQN